MTEVEQAITQIADIRAQLAASSRFRGYAPEAVALVGALALVVLVMQCLWPARFAGTDLELVRSWGMVLGRGLLVIALEAMARALREEGRVFSPALVCALRVTLPGAFLAGVLAFVVPAYAPSACWLVPGLWQMVVGLEAFALYPLMPRRIVWAGCWFLLSGAVGAILAGRDGGLTPLLAGGPFVVGHLAIAWILSDRGNGSAR